MVYIDMNMPKSCDKCKLCHFGYMADMADKVMITGMTCQLTEGLEISLAYTRHERYPYCPLKPENVGTWERMSDLSANEDDRYKCSCCGNIVHHSDKTNLYTFNGWCGRCGARMER